MASNTSGARIAQLVKAWISVLRIAGSSFTIGGVFFWHRPLASLSLHMASVGSDHHAKKYGGPNQWIRVKITPRLQKVHLSLFVKSSRISAGGSVNK